MFEVWPIVFSQPFSIKVVVDGDLSRNDKNYTTLSQIIPESQRSITVTGTIDVTEASEGEVNWYSPPDFDPTSACTQPHGEEHLPYLPPVGAKLKVHSTNLLR
jgi:hypothetical protein